MRKTKETNTLPDLDLTVPIDTFFLPTQEGDCFGLEWSFKDHNCIRCAMTDLCSLKYQEVVAQKVVEVEEKHPVFLDKTDFAKVNELEPKLVQLMLENNGKYPIADLFDAVKNLANTADDVAVAEWVKRFILNNNFKTVQGYVHYKGEVQQ